MGLTAKEVSVIAPSGRGSSSGFGKRFHPIDHVMKMHSGVDIGAPHGSQVRSFAGGTVIFAGRKGGYGNVVDVDHGNGLVTRYAHLSAFNVKVGDQVTKGTHIAAVGSTGKSTGPHLHFEVRKDGRAIDPAPYLKSPGSFVQNGTIDPRELANHHHERGDESKFTPAMQTWRSYMADNVEYHMHSNGLRNNNWRSIVSAEGAAIIEAKMKEFGLDNDKQRNAVINKYYGIFLNKTILDGAEYQTAKETIEKLGALAKLVEQHTQKGARERFNYQDFGIPPTTRATEIAPVTKSPHRDFLEAIVGTPYAQTLPGVPLIPNLRPITMDSPGLIKFIMNSKYPSLVGILLDPSHESFYTTLNLKKVQKADDKSDKSYIAAWKRPDGRLETAWVEGGTVYLASERHGEVVKFQGTRAQDFLANVEKAGGTLYELPAVISATVPPAPAAPSIK